ncbi:hypothetical protein [Endozoicomonas sp.]|uniref:hypothetical protein n=1 Tax=Endozoicomonas sp. TaxID=1892382 RepID=UPI00383A04B9
MQRNLIKCRCDGSNTSNYENAEYDRLYDRMKKLPNGPERLSAINRILAIVQNF